MTFRLGVDIGGTFTDFALINDATGEVTISKQLTTPTDPSVAVLKGTEALLRNSDTEPRLLSQVIHGSTLVTNAVIERKGARTGMLVTRGFRDVLDIAMERRYDLYDLTIRFPDPIIARRRRVEVDGRVQFDGEIVQHLNPDQIVEEVSGLVEKENIEALAVCFLHSFLNPVQELEAREIVKEHFPSLYVSNSADVFPFAREYERWNTTAINAFVQPMADRYLNNLETGLRGLGLKVDLHIVTSNGGTITPETARRYPVRTIESGPAAGVQIAAHHGRVMNLPNLLSYDMGGTTTKGSIIRDGAVRKTYDLEVARIHQFKVGSGLPVKVPAIDLIEIGSGGGGIAVVDDRGVIRVGPESAGAEPGPACYGLGGRAATLADADLVLGYLDPNFFLGGQMQLDKSAAEHAIETNIAKALNVDVERAAWGIHEVINEDVARAFRVHASEVGFDYRDCSMVAFGGSGPVHALRIAHKLHIPRVVFPAAAGVASALGMLVSPLSFELGRSNLQQLDKMDQKDFEAYLNALMQEASSFLIRAGIAKSEIKMTHRLDMRYQGQGYEIQVELPKIGDSAKLFRQLPDLFAKSYESIFSINLLDSPIEIVNWKVEAQGPVPEVHQEMNLVPGSYEVEPKKGTRKAYFHEAGGYIDATVYDRYALNPGTLIQGPALIEENESTCVVGVADTVRADTAGNLVADIKIEGGGPDE